MKKMSMTMKIVLVVLLVMLIVLMFFVRKSTTNQQEPAKQTDRYYVTCDEDAFIVGITTHMYAPGYDVPLIFPLNSLDKDYTFTVDGVEEITAHYYPGTGYLVMFTMPQKEVTVHYQEHDLQGETLQEPAGEISFVREENYSTGLQWEYEVSPEGIVEILEDKYVSEPFDPDEPTTGDGGLRFLKFNTVGSGTVEIQLQQLFQGEVEEVSIYRYQCDGKNAILVESGLE